jgi:hypothetical protein
MCFFVGFLFYFFMNCFLSYFWIYPKGMRWQALIVFNVSMKIMKVLLDTMHSCCSSLNIFLLGILPLLLYYFLFRTDRSIFTYFWVSRLTINCQKNKRISCLGI